MFSGGDADGDVLIIRRAGVKDAPRESLRTSRECGRVNALIINYCSDGLRRRRRGVRVVFCVVAVAKLLRADLSFSTSATHRFIYFVSAFFVAQKDLVSIHISIGRRGMIWRNNVEYITI